MARATIIFILITAFLQIFSQKLYITGYAGYGIGVQKDYYNFSDLNYYATPDTSYSHYMRKLVKESFGTGYRFGGSLGTKISGNISFEMGMEYFKSKPVEFVSTARFTYDYSSTYYVRITDTYLVTGKMIQLSPSLVFEKEFKNIKPFLKLGGIIGFIYMEEDYNGYLTNTIPEYSNVERMQSIFKYKRNTSFGYLIAGGCNYKLMKDFYVFLEARYNNIAYVPEEAEYTKFIENGHNTLSTLSTSERYYEYVDEYYDTGKDNPSSKTSNLKSRYSFGSLSLLVGLRLDLF